MKRNTISLVVAALLLASGARAQEPLQPAVPERAMTDSSSQLRAGRPAAVAAGRRLVPRSAESKVNVRWAANGTVASAAGFASRSYAGSKDEAALSFVREYSDLFGGIDAAKLKHSSTKRIGQRSYVRLRQEIAGVPLRGAEVVVQMTGGNSVQAVTSHVQPDYTLTGSWNLPTEAAIERALTAHGGKPSAAAGAEKQYLLREGNNAVPVWRVTFRSAEPAGDWEYLISADDGSVLQKTNLRQGAGSAMGLAFPQNPVRGGREQVPLDGLTSDKYLTSDQSRVFTYLPALRKQVSPDTFVQGATRGANGNFFYDEDDARASEVQLYYGMQSANEKFRNLGFEGFAEALPGVVFYQDWDADNQRFVGADNAFFSPMGFGQDKGAMFFYLTGRNADTALDTDVIYHEYTHAIVNEIVGGYQSATFKALNEGTADYFSSSFQNDPIMAEYAAKIFGLRAPFLRRSDNKNAWPYLTVGEPHADGNIWSGALWDVRQAGGAAAADDIALNAVAMLYPNSEFYDAASAAVDYTTEYYGARAGDAVATIMSDRGIYTSAAQTASEARWLESGKSVRGSISAARPGFVLLADQQFRIDVPNRATKLIVRASANSAVRFYIRYRVPITIEDGRLQAEQMSAAESEPGGYLSLANTPELQAGTYFIAVVNTTQTPVEYSLQADIEGGDTSAPPAITLLEAGETGLGSSPSGPFLASRQFAVKVPDGARTVTIELEGDQDVDLYVRINAPVYIGGTGYPQADFVSNSEDSRELIRLVPPTGEILRSGIYVIGVYNYSQSTSTFKVRTQIDY